MANASAVRGAAVLLLVAMGSSAYAEGTFSVRDHGARGDRKTNDQASIQAAVDACAKAGGGTVVLPPGDYLSATIRLASGVTLRIEEGATLWASTDAKDYGDARRGNLLVADDAEGVSVIGPGKVHGQGTGDFGSRWGVPETPAFRTGLLLFTGCRRVEIRGVTFLYSDAWTVHLKRCEDVTIDRVTIRNNYRRLNSDGIDPNQCRHVRISNCDIVAGDDCIVLKATEAHPCEDVVVTHCVLESAASALKLGTESFGDFRDIRFENCTIRNSPTGIGFYMKDGGTMERVTFSNIRMEVCDPSHRTVVPVLMDIEKRHPDSKVGKIRDVAFDGLDIHTGSGILIQGMPESPIESLTLRRVSMRVDRPDDYADRKKPVGGRRTTRDDRDTRFARLPSYVTLAHVRGLVVEDVKVEIADEAFTRYERSAVCGREIEDGTFRNIMRRPGTGGEGIPVIDLRDCRNVRILEAGP